MWLDVGLAWLHHLAVFAVAGVIAAELALLSAELTTARLASLGRWDGAYGGLATLALAAGLLRANFGAKGWDFYSGNPVFWTKIALFVAIGLISIVPTVRFIRWRRAGGAVPDADRLAMRRLVVLQAALFALLPLVAALMARGWGHA